VVPRDGASHQLRITAAGYLSHDEDIAFDENQRLAIQLKRATAPVRGKNPRDPRDRPSDRMIDSQSPYDSAHGEADPVRSPSKRPPESR
jgi:hypothetical protein